MAEIWAAALGAAAIGAAATTYAANKSAGAQKRAANGAIAATQQNYDNTAANLNPYIDAGNGALGKIQALNNGDFSSFKQSPDYQFRFDQGLQGLDRSAAARGSLYGGGHSADVLNYAGGMASQGYNDYYSKLAGLAASGQNAATNLGSVGTGNAAAIGSALQGSANATSANWANTANAFGSLAQQGANAYGQYQSSYMPSTSANYAAPTYSGSDLNTSMQVNNLVPQTMQPVAYNYG